MTATEAQFQAFFSKVDDSGLVFWPRFWAEVRQYYLPPAPATSGASGRQPVAGATAAPPSSSTSGPQVCMRE